MAPTTILKGEEFDRSLFESLMKRRFFFTVSFDIYRFSAKFNGDNCGLYDYGPPGCALQADIVDVWRRHFVMEENMLELGCTVITPERVLEMPSFSRATAGPNARDRPVIQANVEALDQISLKALAAELSEKGPVTIDASALSDSGTSTELSSELLTIPPATRLLSTRDYITNVTEPSFGIGRIMYSLLEYMYGRNDELGMPLGITVDFDTLRDGSVTLRERDTMAEVRESEDDVVQAVNLLVDGVESWERISHRLLPFSGQGYDN
ncbi:hypothetical protein DL767_002989 [Monosporascus sp. MG133]|nr:hypothetical protein DL767_002989 [Monosporascus sp. MG133]